MRKEFEMTQEQYDKILEACRPVPYMVFGGMEPRSPQQNANDAWKALGEEMGFEFMTVKAIPGKPKFFTAEAIEVVPKVQEVRRSCFFVGCDKSPEFEIWDENENCPDIGPTDACIDHVGQLLGSVPPTEPKSWRVVHIKIGTEENDDCNRNGCRGTMMYIKDRPCTCHTGNPPCSACTDAKLRCSECGEEV